MKTNNKFNFINKLSSGDIDYDVNIDNIYLSANNPRYTLIDNFDINLIEFINNCKYKNELLNFKNLLKSEGDFKELSRLLDSIEKNNFNNINEPIYLVNSSDNKNYIVAEGNRRLMCLKLINNNFKLDDFLNDENQNYQNSLTDYMDDDNDDEIKKMLNNYKECIKILKKIRQKNYSFNIYYIITKKRDELWSQIYDRHLSGNRPGMREWSRSKYFADLLSIFKNGLIDKDESKITFKFNREWEKIKIDFQEAQYIYSCFFFNKMGINYEIPNFINLDKNILLKMIHSKRISALERNHSFSKIKRLICDYIFKCDDNSFKNNHFNITFSKKNNYRITFNFKNNFPYQKLLSWLLDKWENKFITTRPIKEDIKNLLINELKYDILNNINFNNHLNIIQLNELNEFDFSIDELDKIISANSGFHKDEDLYRFVKASQIKKNVKDIVISIKKNVHLNNLKDIEPIKVFSILVQQLEHNNIDRHLYLNAICSTLRTIIEQIFRWLFFAYLSYSKLEDKKLNFIENVSTNKCYLTSGHINNQKINDSNIDISLRQCLKSTKKLNYFKLELMKFINGDKSFVGLLNENIHSLHRIYISIKYNERLDQISKNQKLIIDLINSIDFNNPYFKELNAKIIEKVNQENKFNNNLS